MWENLGWQFVTVFVHFIDRIMNRENSLKESIMAVIFFAALLEMTQFYTIPAYCWSCMDSSDGWSLDYHYHHHKGVQSLLQHPQEMLGWQGQEGNLTCHLTTGLHLDLTQALNSRLQILACLLTAKYDCQHHRKMVDAGPLCCSSQGLLVLIDWLVLRSVDN